MGKEIKNLDLLIIGAGMAGLTAAIYAGRMKLDVLVLEDELVGGQVREAYMVENYPGFLNISGSDLTEKLQAQALNSGAKIDEFDKILSVSLRDEDKTIETKRFIYKPKAVIIASGSKKIELPIAEEKKFHGKGIHYCEICDGGLYEGRDIAVVGGGNSALLAVKYLSKIVKSITLIIRDDELRGERVVIEEVKSNPIVKVVTNSQIISALGQEKLNGIVIKNLLSNETLELKVDGVFTYIGYKPRTMLYKDQITLTNSGNILADESTKTNVLGVYAAGDIREKPFKQLTTAASDGTVASLNAGEYIRNLKG